MFVRKLECFDFVYLILCLLRQFCLINFSKCFEYFFAVYIVWVCLVFDFLVTVIGCVINETDK